MILLKTLFLSFVAYSKCQSIFTGKLHIVSDLEPENCFLLNKTYKTDPSDGLPKCVNFDDDDEAECVKFNKPDSELVYKPGCAKDGSFRPVQCKGEHTTGRCFCFDVDGKRIFGQQWWNQAENMTCACSRKKAQMGDSVYFNSLHCNSMGNYEALQCDVVSEMCWCADEKTGKLKSPIVPEKAVSKLPCFNTLNVGTQYLRECESKKYAQQNIEHQLSLHGTVATFGDFVCDDDGSYGSYTIIDGSAYCTWRDNSKIGSWSSNAELRATLNCNCARDTKYFEESGKEQLQACSSVGNYQVNQGAGDEAYCVDKDGYRKSEDGVEGITQESDCDTYHAYDD